MLALLLILLGALCVGALPFMALRWCYRRLREWIRGCVDPRILLEAERIGTCVATGPLVDGDDPMGDFECEFERIPRIVRRSVLMLRSKLIIRRDTPENRAVVGRAFCKMQEGEKMRPTHIAQFCPIVVEAFFIPMQADILANAVRDAYSTKAAKRALDGDFSLSSFLSRLYRVRHTKSA